MQRRPQNLPHLPADHPRAHPAVCLSLLLSGGWGAEPPSHPRRRSWWGGKLCSITFSLGVLELMALKALPAGRVILTRA